MAGLGRLLATNVERLAPCHAWKLAPAVACTAGPGLGSGGVRAPASRSDERGAAGSDPYPADSHCSAALERPPHVAAPGGGPQAGGARPQDPSTGPGEPPSGAGRGWGGADRSPADAADTSDAEGWSGRDPQLGRMLRADLVAERAAAQLFAGMAACSGRRPDLRYYQEREEALTAEARAMAPRLRARPSLAAPLLGAAGWALGAAAAALPRRYGAAITSGVAEALDDQYNGQLRDLHERTAGAGAGDARAEALRALVRRLRDEPRALDTSVKARALGSRVPNLVADVGLNGVAALQQLKAEEGIAGAVKLGLAGLLSVGARV